MGEVAEKIVKKSQPVKSFIFKELTHQEVVDILNKEYPVKIEHNEDLVNRICARYPFISKMQVSIVVRAVFQSFRDLLVLGKVFSYCFRGHII